MEVEKPFTTDDGTVFEGEGLPRVDIVKEMERVLDGINNDDSTIKKDLKFFSNTETVTRLTFPSCLIGKTNGRFSIDGAGKFLYKGRPEFFTIYDVIRDTPMNTAIFLKGPSGWGKSHILAALAYFCFCAGSLVLYIPDASQLLTGDMLQILVTALRTACHPIPIEIDDIATRNIPTEEKWTLFKSTLVRLANLKDRFTCRAIFIVDQLDNLKAIDRMDRLFDIGTHLQMVYSASSNIQDPRHREPVAVVIRCTSVNDVSIHILSLNLC